MTRVFNLDNNDRTDLEILLSGDVDLIKHYKKAKELYEFWGEQILTDSVKVFNEDMSGFKEQRYGTQKSIKLLSGMIHDFDKHLRKLFSHKKRKDRIGFDFKKVCNLFAKNTLSKTPVEER